ncbi:MAG TPA: pyrimidine dimer DNA glycosylase/endonuclease V [Anaerolineales bacterium]|nr:pyrimidine dimer DNA glycosylase/endonuclease V [Anaerolineales bacterium]
MRLWSLHPGYLDTIGLVACWREGLLARSVLQGKTRGYRNHPQLLRFKAQTDPLAALDQYLSAILDEAKCRGFAFDPTKVCRHAQLFIIPVTDGQLKYELNHLQAKLIKRDIERYESLSRVAAPLPNPIFCVIRGEIEVWEKVPQVGNA